MRPLFSRPFLFSLGFSILFSIHLALSPAKQAEVVEIDQKIEELQEMKRGYEGRALRHEDYAQRLQFDNGAYLETRRHIQLAEENRAKAALLQQEIDQLKEKKAKLLKS